jgi:hypothetical protein
MHFSYHRARSKLLYERKWGRSRSSPRDGKKHRRRNCSDEKGSGDLEKGVGASDFVGSGTYNNGTVGGRPSPDTESPGLHHLYEKDVFVAEGDGRPRSCSMCMNWKPDRPHRYREIDRCARKMDHFCPWSVQSRCRLVTAIHRLNFAAIFKAYAPMCTTSG